MLPDRFGKRESLGRGFSQPARSNAQAAMQENKGRFKVVVIIEGSFRVLINRRRSESPSARFTN